MKEVREAGFLISKIHQVSERIFFRLLKDRGLEINPAQGRILFALWKEDEIPIRDLSKKTQLEKSTLTSMLDRLEQSGFVERVPSKDDRRKILIRRTDKDRSYQDHYVRVSGEMNDLFYRGFSKVEMDSFEASLKKILANLEDA